MTECKHLEVLEPKCLECNANFIITNGKCCAANTYWNGVACSAINAGGFTNCTKLNEART